MKVPLNDRQIAIEQTMPRNPTGHIVNPRYVPESGWGHAYIKQWGQWCREHPKGEWPDWLSEYVEDRRRAKEVGTRGILERHGRRSPLAGNGDSQESGGVSGQSGELRGSIAA